MATSPRSMSQALVEEYRNKGTVPAMLSEVPASTYVQPGTGTGGMQSPMMGTRSSDPVMNAIAGALLGAAGEMIYRRATGAGGGSGAPKIPGGGGGGGGGKAPVEERTLKDIDQLPSGPLIPGEDLEKEFPYDMPMPDEILDLEESELAGPYPDSEPIGIVEIGDLTKDDGITDIGEFEGIDLSGGSAGNVADIVDVYEVPGTTIDITDNLTGDKSQAVYPGASIGDALEITPDFDFSGWLDLGDGAYKAPDGGIYVDESFIQDLDLENLFNNFDFSNYDFGGSYGPSYDWSDYGSYGFKDGGMATPLMSKGGLPAYANAGEVDVGMAYGDDVPSVTSTGSANTSSGGSTNWIDSILSGLSGITDITGAKGAILGALLSSLVGKSGGTSEVNKGFDWQNVGIAPRETTFGMGAPRFVPYSSYTARPDVADIYQKTNLYESLGAPAYETSDADSPVMKSALDIYKPFNTQPQTPLAFPQSPLSYNVKFADGGGVDTSYYTYGKPVDPMEKLAAIQQMRHGGRTDETSSVPEVGGRYDYRQGARVTGQGDGQSDDIPAWLADGEYVIDAETVAQLGNGSTKAGSDMLDKFREEIRKHKRSAKKDDIPPPSKSPMQYLAMAGRK